MQTSNGGTMMNPRLKEMNVDLLFQAIMKLESLE